MPTIFELIVKGEIPCHKIWEDDRYLAFLDINPRVEGHTLVIPKHPWDEVFAMPREDYDALWTAARTVAHQLEQRTGCARVVVVVLGYDVPHVHIHLMPTNRLEDFPFPLETNGNSDRTVSCRPDCAVQGWRSLHVIARRFR
jgi:histidine triad (HIT) family protein